MGKYQEKAGAEEISLNHLKRGRKKKGELSVQATRLTTQPAGLFIRLVTIFN
jgi:hypothetical protein